MGEEIVHMNRIRYQYQMQTLVSYTTAGEAPIYPDLLKLQPVNVRYPTAFAFLEAASLRSGNIR